MDISLIRHGEAEDIGGKIKTDGDRPLTEQGMKDIRMIAKAMDRLGMGFTAILSSPLERAHKTAEIIADVLKSRDLLKITESLSIPPSRTALLQELRQFTKDDHILLVGHEPNMGMLTSYFLGNDKMLVNFKKGSLCKIEVLRFHPTPRGELKWFLTPKQMKWMSET